MGAVSIHRMPCSTAVWMASVSYTHLSYAFTTQGGCPDAAAQFGGQELETNGFCWQVPLLGGRLDNVFASPATLTVQKLGTLYTAHPDITLPDWASYTTLTDVYKRQARRGPSEI